MEMGSYSWVGIAFAMFGVVGCGSGSNGAGGGTDANAQAKAEFWSSFGGGDMNGVVTAQSDLLSAFPSNSNDAETARLIGMSYLGLVSETTGQTSPPTQSEIPTYIENAGKYLLVATQVTDDPDERTWNSAFYAGIVFTGGNPNAPPDPTQQADGRAMYQAVVDRFPVFGLFNRAAQLGRSAKASADFASALDSFFQAYAICTGTNVDRTSPDISSALTGASQMPSTLDEPCGNLPHVPHNIQGEAFAFADMLVKNGQVDAARGVYQAIQQSDGYSTWAFSDEVGQRLSSDLTARAALYDNPDSTTWPAIGASRCFACHER
jgi:hypothetical protein